MMTVNDELLRLLKLMARRVLAPSKRNVRPRPLVIAWARAALVAASGACESVVLMALLPLPLLSNQLVTFNEVPLLRIVLRSNASNHNWQLLPAVMLVGVSPLPMS